LVPSRTLSGWYKNRHICFFACLVPLSLPCISLSHHSSLVLLVVLGHTLVLGPQVWVLCGAEGRGPWWTCTLIH
jgi:hypothetical protein